MEMQILLSYLFNSPNLTVSDLFYTGVNKRVNIKRASTQPPKTRDDSNDNILQWCYASSQATLPLDSDGVCTKQKMFSN